MGCAFIPPGGKDHSCCLASETQLSFLESRDRIQEQELPLTKASVPQHQYKYKTKNDDGKEENERSTAKCYDKSGNDDESFC